MFILFFYIYLYQLTILKDSNTGFTQTFIDIDFFFHISTFIHLLAADNKYLHGPVSTSSQANQLSLLLGDGILVERNGFFPADKNFAKYF